MPGVSIEPISPQCVFTLKEVAAGIHIPYNLVVASALSNLVPEVQDIGYCDQPDESGLILFEKLTGSGQNFCLCDTGGCMQDDRLVSLVPGIYAHSFDWIGKNWRGPSDTGDSQGAPFPTGTYSLDLSAKGTVGQPG